MKKKKLHGIETLKSKYGLMFVSIWIIGFVLFFFIPLCQSVGYAFSEISLGENGLESVFIGFQNFKKLLKEDPNYTKDLISSMGQMLYSLPMILVVSLLIAIILNKRFFGRLFFRALYFLPVIIATGAVMQLISGKVSADDQMASTVTQNMFTVEDVMGVFNLPTGIATTVQEIISAIFSLVWKCGIQIVLFIAGLQSIPSSLYEVSKVEGATPWENFWFITFPMLSRVTLLVGIFTIIELFTDSTSPIIKTAFEKMSVGIYDVSSAMLWFYFLIAAAMLGLVVFLYTYILMRRWD